MTDNKLNPGKEDKLACTESTHTSLYWSLIQVVNMTTIKQLIVLRRKAGLTRKEFFDYHYQEHGKISTGPDPAENPT